MDSGRLEVVPGGPLHLDTVRALHQTVVSLRTALEVSKNELKELKEKYEQHSHCFEYTDVIEKLTLENHVLRRRIIDSDFDVKDPATQNIKLEVSYSPRSRNTNYPDSEVVIQTATEVLSAKDLTDNWEQPVVSDKECSEPWQVSEVQSPKDYLEPWQHSVVNSNFCSSEKLNEIPEVSESPELNISHQFSPLESPRNIEQEEQSHVVSISKHDHHLPGFKTHLELLSKFDVRIKVRTLKDGAVTSSSTSDSDFTFDEKRDKKTNLERTFEFDERRRQFDNREDLKGNKVNLESVSTENIKMAVPNEGDVKSKTDKFDVQVKITSEENLVVKENIEGNRRKDTLNLDVDDLSLRSLSEGENSVFSECGMTPAEPPAADNKHDHEASGNESEEVDDIELIFTTDESKDMSMNLQEDLVSIRESEPWAPTSASTHSTPVLIKFHTLDPDFQPGTETDIEKQESSETIPESALKIKRVSLPSDKEIRHVAFNGKEGLNLPSRGILKSGDNKSDITLYKKSPNTSTRRLDSVDSLTCEYNRGLSFDNTKSSSFELGLSMDILNRDESMDSFHRTGHLGHRFSVFAERDISKCGTSEDDLAVNLNVRRNTCPNPFQYRVPPYRGVSRPPGPFKVPISSSRVRPVIRDPVNPRREHGVQTDVSALPNRWSSDGYLAHKLVAPATHAVPTLPTRGAVVRRPLSREARAPPPRRTDETRRVLLSDIGFTSMVPELSRSADPVWALARKQQDEDLLLTNTSKFLARGSSYRSPSLSTDHSYDWTPYYGHVPALKSDYRTWRSSLPDVRRDDTDDLLEEAETFVRRSIGDLHDPDTDVEKHAVSTGHPYIPAGPRQLRLGHAVKVITPQGRIAVGRVRYVGLAGGTAASSSVVIGVEFSLQQYPYLARNDGTHRGRRYFLTPPLSTAVFVPFSKVVMAWAY